jgi:hypothetical protein
MFYLYVESKLGNGFQFIPFDNLPKLNLFKTKVDETGLFNTNIIIP